MADSLKQPSERTRPDLSALRIAREDDVPARQRGIRSVLLGTSIVVLAGIGLVIGYRIWSGSALPEVEVARAAIESGSAGMEILTATGYVVADRKAAVSPKISGRLEYLAVDTGSRVKPGEIIARLEHRDLDAQLADARGSLASFQAAQTQTEAEIEQARAALMQAQANRQKSNLNLARQSKLFEQGVGAKADYDNAIAQARVDEAQVKTAEAQIAAFQAKLNSAAAQIRSAEARIQVIEAQLEYTNIRSPFEGLVISKDAEVGETVAPAIFGGSSTRGSVVTIVDPNTLEVEADINESSIGKIAPGVPAEVSLDALPGEKLPADVRKIVPTADRQKATVKVKVRFKSIDPRILPDMSAKITFLEKRDPGAKLETARVTVPKSAIQQRDGRPIVLILIDDRVKQQSVTPGSEFGDRVEIKQGLAGGEVVVVRGGDGLGDGSQVKRKTDE
ncbi:MAG TPA: efflux RND transporter periplasmic adaptor subunit [Blastocatellia bacterium]|nr:efflux RND transporter periplasmic adaptor subunit [Blastocatellia bacterium]